MKKIALLAMAFTLIIPAAHSAGRNEPEPAPAQASPTPTVSASAAPASSEKESAPAKTAKGELEKIALMIEAKKYQEARSALLVVDKTFPNDANVNNLLGYTSRKLNLYSSSAVYYKKALMINPKHRGALEYQGELFILQKKYSLAAKNLKTLASVCGVKCEEYLELKAALGNKK